MGRARSTQSYEALQCRLIGPCLGQTWSTWPEIREALGLGGAHRAGPVDGRLTTPARVRYEIAMGLFDFLRRENPEPDTLRDELFDAVDSERFEELCERHEDMLVEHAPSWSKVPDAVQRSPEAMQRYAELLFSLAQWLAGRGHHELLTKITGGAGDNPLTEAESQLHDAQELMRAMRFAEAEGVLDDLKPRFDGLQGPGRDHYLAFIEGFLGECRFQLGRPAEAIAPTRRAHELCLANGELGAAASYLASIYEMHRYPR
jgi:hypothetical protein